MIAYVRYMYSISLLQNTNTPGEPGVFFSHEQDVIGKEPVQKGTVYHAVDCFYTDYMLNAQCVGYSLPTS